MSQIYEPDLEGARNYETLRAHMSPTRVTVPAVKRLLASKGVPKKIRDIAVRCLPDRKGYSSMTDPIMRHTYVKRERAREALEKKYADVGVTVEAFFRADWKKPRIVNVSVGHLLTTEQWVDVLNTEGDILGACCAQISHARDLLSNAVRGDYQMRPWELAELVGTLEDHGPLQYPWVAFWALKNRIWDDAQISPEGHAVDPSALEGAIDVLADSARTLLQNRLFSRSGDDKEDEHHKAIDAAHQLHRITPAVRTIHYHLLASNVPPVDGWAMCRGNEVLTGTLGLAVYATEDRAKYWKGIFDADTVGPKNPVPLKIRRVNVSVAHGIVFLD